MTLGLSALALTPPLLIPGLFEHSTYLIGIAAVLVCAAWTGPASAAVAAGLIVCAGLWIERNGDIGLTERIVRAFIFAGIATAAADVSRRLRGLSRQSAESLRSLARKEAVLRSILETGPDAMLVINSRGLVSRFSKSAERLFGWTEGEVLGRNVSMLMPEPYHREHDGYIARYLATGEKRIIGMRREVTGLRRDGSVFPMVLHVGEISVDGERHFSGFVHDLTSLNEAQARNEELRRQLTNAWRMNSLGEMAAMLAHELNQPLAAISNYVRGAVNMVNRLELKDDDLVNVLESTGQQAIRAGEIIRRARGMVAREPLQHQRESINELVQEVGLMMALVAREAGVQLNYRLSESTEGAEVDRIQIQQVLGNLMRNALDAMADRPDGILEIETEREQGQWVVRIHDTGPGVDPRMANQLFEPMATTKSGGLGLGLSISRTIIEHHGGAIWVERSRLGGAAFCFSLPDGSGR